MRLDGEAAALARRFAAERPVIRDVLEKLRAAADDLDAETTSAAAALDRLRAVHTLLVERVLPHEEAEGTLLYPAMARTLGGIDPTATMSRARVEIAREIARLGWAGFWTPAARSGSRRAISSSCGGSSTGCMRSSCCTPRRKRRATCRWRIRNWIAGRRITP